MDKPPKNVEDINKAEEDANINKPLKAQTKLDEIRANMDNRSQEKMAEFLGVSVSTYKNWEAGKYLPHKTTRIMVAKKLGLQVEDIWSHLEEEQEKTKPLGEEPVSEDITDNPVPIAPPIPQPDTSTATSSNIEIATIPLDKQPFPSVPVVLSQPASQGHLKRREFLRHAGLGAAILIGGGIIYLATHQTVSPTHPISQQIGVWKQTGNMSTRRLFHSATLLQNGTVLVAGGREADGVLIPYAEIYDPIRGAWQTRGKLITPRLTNNSLVTLHTGKALLVGGLDASNNIGLDDDFGSAELYYPTTETWFSTGSLSTPRRSATTTLLANGWVLVAAGARGFPDANQFLSSAEIYNPNLGIWRNVGDLTVARQGANAVLLPNGNIMIAGGEGPQNEFGTVIEFFHPITGTWSTGKDMLWGWVGASMTVLHDGRVFVAGGEAQDGQGNTTIFSTAAFYDPAINTWTYTPPMSIERSEHTATLLPNNQVLVVGGHSKSGVLQSCELFDPNTNTWFPGPSLLAPRRGHIAITLSNGDVLVIGGLSGDLHSELDTCERLQIIVHS